MKVLILSTYENIGGAAIAASRLCSALNKNGVEAKMLCRRNLSWWPGKKPQSWTSIIERGIIWAANGFSMKNLWAVDIALLGQDITKTKEYRDADVIHLHWINQGFISFEILNEILNSGKKIVLTMHDMWYCTSICHHSYECDRYEGKCGECRFLNRSRRNDLSTKIYEQKMAVFGGKQVNIVAVSAWLACRARKSAFLSNANIQVVPNFISMDDFSLYNRKGCRSLLKINNDAKVIVFCAARLDDPIKGLGILIQALSILIHRHPKIKSFIMLRLIGDIKDYGVLTEIPVNYYHVGIIKDMQLLNKEYCAADVLASTSLFETFGQTLIEAQASGCLPVTFGQGGQKEIINHLKNGYVASEQTPEAFAEGLLWALTNRNNISPEELRKYVEDNYSEDVVVRNYMEIYKS